MLKKLLFTLVCLSGHAFADQVIGISDGDTLTVLHDRRPVRIRLANIDAPEKAQAFGERSKQSLSDLCYGKDATYQTVDVDQYGRTVAVVTCNGVNVNQAQVARGMAWVYTRYNQDGSLPSVEARARQAKVGLWSESAPTPPWLFRRESTARR